MEQKQAVAVQEYAKCIKKSKFKPRKRADNKPLTKEQVRKVMLIIGNLRDAALLHLGFNTGMRVSEALSFTQDAIDWEAGTIRIWDEKKDKYRDVMPPLETMNKLKLWINESKPAGNPVFNFSINTTERIIQKWVKKALGIDKSWHCVRHTYISLSNEANQNIRVVIENTGDSPATILRYYTHLTPDYRRKATEEKPVYSEGGI